MIHFSNLSDHDNNISFYRILLILTYLGKKEYVLRKWQRDGFLAVLLTLIQIGCLR